MEEYEHLNDKEQTKTAVEPQGDDPPEEPKTMEIALEDSEAESEEPAEELFQVEQVDDRPITSDADNSVKESPHNKEVILRPSGTARRAETLPENSYEIEDDEEPNIFEIVWQWAVDRVVP